MLADEQKRRSADAKTFAAEIEGLASRDMSAWPANLRTLFQQNTKSAADVRSSSKHAAYTIAMSTQLYSTLLYKVKLALDCSPSIADSKKHAGVASGFPTEDCQPIS